MNEYQQDSGKAAHKTAKKATQLEERGSRSPDKKFRKKFNADDTNSPKAIMGLIKVNESPDKV